VATEPIREEVIFSAEPRAVYELLLDSGQFAQATGQPAALPREVGEEGTAYGGNIVVVNRELVPGSRIVQDWRLAWDEWPETVWASATFELAPEADGTRLSLTLTGVPEVYHEHVSEGWDEHYWAPMRRVLEGTGSSAPAHP
jgi:activator of HSP90 ATPase